MLEIFVASSVKTVKLPLLTSYFSIFLALIKLVFLRVVFPLVGQFGPPFILMLKDLFKKQYVEKKKVL